MAPYRVTVELFAPEVLKIVLKLDGHPVEMKLAKPGHWQGNLEGLDTRGPIRLHFKSAGTSGELWSLHVRIQEGVPAIFHGFFEDGFAEKTVEVPVLPVMK